MDVDALTTAHIADACIRAGLPVRCGPAGLVGVDRGMKLAGRVLPVRHAGSVDLYLEALEGAEPGDVLVVDNDGLMNEACVGDLVALEVAAAGLAGIVIWGLHRDTADILEIGLPVFSLGSTSTGPLRVQPAAPDALSAATIGDWTVTTEDVVIGDEDGIVFVEAASIDRVLGIARGIRDTERRQAELIRGGRSLRDQVRFAEYLAARAENPALTFREHLTGVGGAIEV